MRAFEWALYSKNGLRLESQPLAETLRETLWN